MFFEHPIPQLQCCSIIIVVQYLLYHHSLVRQLLYKQIEFLYVHNITLCKWEGLRRGVGELII